MKTKGKVGVRRSEGLRAKHLSQLTYHKQRSQITTAVSADLGQHESLKNDAALMATVTGIIDGTGSLGAAFNGIVVGDVTSMDNGWLILFVILCAANTLAAVMLARVLIREIKSTLSASTNSDEGARDDGDIRQSLI